jgi:hypothetical protein
MNMVFILLLLLLLTSNINMTWIIIYTCRNIINKLKLPYSNDTFSFPISMKSCCKYNMEKKSFIKMVEGFI